MKKAIILSMLLLAAITTIKAQSKKGNPQIGVRLGLPLGPTARYFFNDANAVEGIVGLYNRTISVTGLYERHFDLSALTTEGFAWYAGGGGHIGTRVIDGSTKFLAGVDGIAGLDYTLRNTPINFSLDWKPAIHFTTSSELADFALSVRCVLGR
jgi:hypothetical protein